MPTFNVSPIVKLAAAAILGLVLFFVLRSCMTKDARTETAAAKVDAQLSDARAASGADAVGTVGNAAAREDQVQDITRENDVAIHSAPGADAPVDPALGSVARAGLCRYAAYRDSEQCKRLLGTGSQ